MRITRETVVKDAVESSREARAIFIRHGIDPLEKCRGVYDMATLGEVELWCHVRDLDGLIAELNEALAASGRRAGA